MPNPSDRYLLSISISKGIRPAISSTAGRGTYSTSTCAVTSPSLGRVLYQVTLVPKTILVFAELDLAPFAFNSTRSRWQRMAGTIVPGDALLTTTYDSSHSTSSSLLCCFPHGSPVHGTEDVVCAVGDMAGCTRAQTPARSHSSFKIVVAWVVVPVIPISAYAAIDRCPLARGTPPAMSALLFARPDTRLRPMWATLGRRMSHRNVHNLLQL